MTSGTKSSSLTCNWSLRRRERMGGRRSKTKKTEKIISEICPYIMKTIKLIDPGSSMNSMKGKHKEKFHTKDYHNC